MRNWISGAAAIAAAALLSAASTLPARAQDTGPINIAALYNLTSGGLSSLDAPSFNGAKLKAKMINEAGGLLGGRMIELTAIDTKNDTRETATAAQRAVAIPGLSAGIGQSDSTFALAAAPLFQTAGIAFVTSGATAPDLPEMVGDKMFLVPFGDDVQAHAMAEYAYGTLGLRNVAVWTDNAMDYTTGLSRYFTERFTELGGKVVLEDVYMTTDQDFSALVSRLQSTEGVDAIFASSGPDTAGIIVKQLREAGVALPILAGDGFDTDLVLSVPGEALAKDVYFTTHAYAGIETGPAQEFRTAYQADYGTPPENAFAALGYDAVGLVADAITRAGTSEPAAVAKALAETKGFEGVTGTIVYPEGGRVPTKPVAIIKVGEGKMNFETTVTPKG
ncbi:ABC transporter substrate-binding protein [Antarcticirhabdus aurantiaca]|uniref:ABC transporter substrate-binding protein n=1 Tax=Antarcticirhabdus aurantiaca TaxID=2606717 RepID=A0ACD4NN54_9HYPH|nr:ABC transporter substrate-binding protein [Antarcticirhabdus aurantiaca]WAJ28183.1 ABC transporter substrate-binding protein [Jeongeuplla avenae]